MGSGAVTSLFTNYRSDYSGGDIRKCWLVTVDVNGAKKTNQVGRDTFFYYISGDDRMSLLPRPTSSGDGLAVNYCGYWTSANYEYYDIQCNPKYTGNGVGGSGMACAHRIMRRGWKMGY